MRWRQSFGLFIFYMSFAVCSQKPRAQSEDLEHVVVKPRDYRTSSDNVVLYQRKTDKTQQNICAQKLNEKLRETRQWSEISKLIIHTLTESDCDPNKILCRVSEYDKTMPLYEGVCRDDFLLVQLLLKKGADVDLCVGTAQQREHILLYAKSLRMIQLLCEYRNKNKLAKPISSIKTLFGGSILHDMVWKINDPEVISWYVEQGLDVNGVDDKGETPLSKLIGLATQVNNNLTVVRNIQALIRAGAALEVVISNGDRVIKKNVVQKIQNIIDANKPKMIITDDKQNISIKCFQNQYEIAHFKLYSLLLKTVTLEHSNREKKAKQALFSSTQSSIK